MIFQEFTGERFVPGQGGCQLAYEHLHRYLFAARWAKGRRVIDVASGSGYGAAMLAREAGQVWAVDLDASTIALARCTYKRENLHFVNADATCLPFQGGVADLVVALEVVEHLADQEGLVRELARVTRPGGAVLISTPDKSAYSDARNYSNPFHVHEFYRDEFIALLTKHFSNVQLLHQQVRAGSLIARESDSEGESEIIAGPAPEEGSAPSNPMYFLALCSGKGNLEPAPSASAYLDPTDALFMEWVSRLREANSEISRLNAEIEKLGRWSGDLEGMVAERDQSLRELQEQSKRELLERDATIRSLQEESLLEIARRDETIAQLQKEFEERTRWAMSLSNDLAIKDRQLEHANSELRKVGEHLALIRHAFLYRVLCRLGLLPK